MDFSIYIFTFFIFILTALIVILLKKIQSTDSKESQAVIDKEKKLFKLYQNLEEMILEAEDLIEESKLKIEDDKNSIHKMLEKADNVYSQARYEAIESVEKAAKVIKKSNVVDMNIKSEVIKQKGKINRKQKVIILNKEGRSVEEISKELDISQGEVGLIIGLNR